ncbi:GMC family oxidoreductase N-terminal domain-containing protein [Bdellovibrio sp. HCB185ZH]|uniref:GMC family oxidoreductase N-terminal domain-containing protein n=1 Tax=Bdellovibrio sp. HCB185ZH TaxID=3394235 RepID=UPI0039A5E974
MGISRRSFLKSGFVAGLVGAFARTSLAEPQVKFVPLKIKYTPLANPLSDLRERYDVVVIGSGYGGSVAAARLAGRCRVAVLERGPERPPGSFTESFEAVRRDVRCKKNPFGLFEIHANHEMDVLNGNGLGGTSLINAGAMVRPDRDTFRFPEWPRAIVDEIQGGEFEKYFSRVKSMLQGHAFNPATMSSAKVRAHEYASREMGVDVKYPPIAVNLYGEQSQQRGVTQPKCIECGNCCSGCNTGAKNTLNMNYLPLAKNQGAEIYTQMEVLWIEKTSDGYRLHCLYISNGGDRLRKTISASQVIVSAGTMGSSKLLLNSRNQGLSLSDKLGRRFSGNGDVLGLSFNTSFRTNAIGFSSASRIRVDMKPGAVIYSLADYRNKPNLFDRFIIEEGTFPGAFTMPLRLAMGIAKFRISAARYLRVGRDITLSKDIEKGALNYSMVYLGMGHDRADGKLQLDRKGRIRVRWPEVKYDPIYPTIDRAMKAQSRALGGNFVMNPRTLLINGKNLVTVHPLGGCVMADSVENGVVNHLGQVYRADGKLHEGLYVLDGSIVPTALGVNPLLTISALAERAVERMQLT